MTGKPISSAAVRSSAIEEIPPSDPGVTGTPASIIRRRASILSPMARMTSPEGPTKTRPSASQASAKSPFSARNPYPGCTAPAPERRAASITAPAFRYDSAAGGGPMQ